MVKYSEAQRKKVLQLFWRTELRWLEDIVDNESLTIANETGVDIGNVNRIINQSINKKILRIHARIRAKNTI